MNIVAGYNDNSAYARSGTICRFYQKGICRFGNRCRNIHANGRPNNQNVQLQCHNSPNLQIHRHLQASNTSPKNVVASTSSSSGTSSSPNINRNKTVIVDRECGICFDAVMEKSNRREQTFGILPNCNHCFCFTCIRTWRQSKEFDFEVSKACPECRIPSDYVYPSKIWFELKEEKDTFITKEKTRMQKVNCRYFNQGVGTCPFGNTCLYLHALPNGQKMDVGPPKPRRRRADNLDDSSIYEILFWLNNDEFDVETDDDDNDDDTLFDADDDDLDLEDDLLYYDSDDDYYFNAAIC